MEGDNLVSKEKLGHWSKELNVEELVGDKVEKKEEEVEGKMDRVGCWRRLIWGIGRSGGEGRLG